MTEPAAAQAVTRSTFPPPPPFWRLYPSDTPPSLLHSSPGSPPPSPSSLPSPFSLPLFLPPPIPPTPLIAFQQLRPVHPSPPSLPPDVPRLYPVSPTGAVDFPAALSSLTSSLLVAFLALLGTVTGSDGEREDGGLGERLSAVTHGLFNLTHLLALLRSHQGLQALLVLVERQRAARRAKADHLREEVDRVRWLLAQYGCEWEAQSREVACAPLNIKQQQQTDSDHIGALHAEAAAERLTERGSAKAEGKGRATDVMTEEEARTSALWLRSLLEAVPDRGE